MSESDSEAYHHEQHMSNSAFAIGKFISTDSIGSMHYLVPSLGCGKRSVRSTQMMPKASRYNLYDQDHPHSSNEKSFPTSRNPKLSSWQYIAQQHAHRSQAEPS